MSRLQGATYVNMEPLPMEDNPYQWVSVASAADESRLSGRMDDPFVDDDIIYTGERST